MRLWIAIIAATLLGSISLAGLTSVYAQSPDSGVTVNGQVVNGTLGASPPAQVLVLALVTDGDGRVDNRPGCRE